MHGTVTCSCARVLIKVAVTLIHNRCVDLTGKVTNFLTEILVIYWSWHGAMEQRWLP